MAFFSSKKTAAETPIPEVMEEHMNNESMPAHKYDDDGIRRDGINPLTHSGYWEEEQ